MGAEEQVLVIPRTAFDAAGAFHGLNFDVQPYLEKIFAPGVPTFIPRPRAEKDPASSSSSPTSSSAAAASI